MAVYILMLDRPTDRQTDRKLLQFKSQRKHHWQIFRILPGNLSLEDSNKKIQKLKNPDLLPHPLIRLQQTVLHYAVCHIRDKSQVSKSV